jgi:uncharacterized protein (TIGR01777 family)
MSDREPLHIALTGSTGLIGSSLVSHLVDRGHQVTRIVRSSPGRNEIQWDPEEGVINAAGLDGVDVVVHLAAENIAARRWSAAFKERIRDSRVNGTQLLCRALAELDRPPKVLLSASAVGYYGDRGDELLDETSSAGEGFLPETCVAWEEAAQPAREAGIRVVYLRFGLVLSPQGGSLAKMLTPFKLGLGGRVGNGRQYWSWISIDDAVGAICHAMQTETLSGPVNVVSPTPETNRQFTRILGRVLRRPTFFPAPAFALRAAFGQMADDCLLASTRVHPAQLIESGYEFHHPDLETALRHELDKPA